MIWAYIKRKYCGFVELQKCQTYNLRR